jgi:hypothetical protein
LNLLELKKQAGIQDNPDQEGLDLFAELIVKECADVVSNQYSEDWGKWSNRMILEHFGVEE